MITVNVMNKDSIDKAIRDLRRYEDKLKKAEKEIARQLAEIGMKVVELRFYEVEPTEFDIYTEPTESGYAIVANGEDIMFIEFGAGMSTEDYEHPEAEGLPPIVAGEWSRNEGTGQFASKGYWWHNREKFYGYPSFDGIPAYPAHGFYEANKEMQKRAEEVIRRVLKK